MPITRRLVHATVVPHPAPCASVLAAATLPLSFAFMKDGRLATRIVPSLCRAAAARHAVPVLMELDEPSRCFPPSFSIYASVPSQAIDVHVPVRVPLSLSHIAGQSVPDLSLPPSLFPLLHQALVALPPSPILLPFLLAVLLSPM